MTTDARPIAPTPADLALAEYDRQITEMLNERGMCGAIEGSRACLRDIDHESPHGWEVER